MPSRKSFFFWVAFGIFFTGHSQTHGSAVAGTNKITPTLTVNYRITNGEKGITVGVTRMEGEKVVPVTNLIVNLYLTQHKKYDPATGEGWIGNHVTDQSGHVYFSLPVKVLKLKENSHTFFFIASIGSDPIFKDTHDSITMADASIELFSGETAANTRVVAKFSKSEENGVVAIPQKEIKFFVKRGAEEIPFGRENRLTDMEGVVSEILPEDIFGNENNTITVLARFEDKENHGIIEVSRDIPWKAPKGGSNAVNQKLWSGIRNAPVALVIALAMVLIMLIFFVRAKKKQ
ncbi:MAG: hypothetical protein PSX36_06335 [bacterium]|nr:hypothetical protein [bacterium]